MVGRDYSVSVCDGRFSNWRTNPCILYLTIGVQLANAGFSSTRTSDGAQYTLVVGYVSRKTEADIDFALFASADGERPLAETAFLLHIDYSLDSEVAAAVDRLLELADLNGDPGQNPSRVSAIEGVFSRGIGAEMSPDEILAATALRLDTSLGLGGIVFFGWMTDYFHYGATSAVSFAVRKPWKSWNFSLGARCTGTRVFNDSGVKGGPLYLSTAGADIGAGTGYRWPFILSAAASGGAAVITVAGDDQTLSKTVPYADAGARIRLPVGRGFFAGVDVRYLLVFDTDVLIMGVVPVLSISKDL